MLILLILNDDVSIAGKIFFKIERANECFVKVRFLSFFFFKPQYLFRKICSLGVLKCPFFRVSLVAQTVKNLPAMWRPGFNSWVRKIPWRRNWQPTPVFLPGESNGRRSLAGCSPQGHRESDTTAQTCICPFF